MFAELTFIPLTRLAIIFLPVALVIAIHWRWSLKPGEAAIATVRMLLQLLLIGYVLTFIFETHHPTIVGAVLSVMLLAASWIALRGANDFSRAHYLKVLASIVLGGGLTLVLVTQGVLTLRPWFDPHKVVPLGGMVFAGAMNAVALASERFASEISSGASYIAARRTAMRAAMIPTTNALLAVGLVSIPGMMTGQVLAGVDPLIAASYQIMVMAMVYSSAGLSAAAYLAQLRPADDDAEA